MVDAVWLMLVLVLMLVLRLGLRLRLLMVGWKLLHHVVTRQRLMMLKLHGLMGVIDVLCMVIHLAGRWLSVASG